MGMITDLSPYRQYLDDFDLTDEQKLALVNDLRTFAQVIVDKHFKLHVYALPIFPNKPVDSDAVRDHAEKEITNGDVHENET